MILVVVLLAIGIVRTGLSFQNAQERLDRTRQLVAVMSDKVEELRRLPPDLTIVDSLESDLLEVQRQLLETRRDLGWVLTIAPYFTWLPVVGTDLGALGPLLNASLDTVDAGRLVLTSVSETLPKLPALLSTESQEGEPLEKILPPYSKTSVMPSGF